MGVACGLGAWAPVVTSVVLVALLLSFGKPLERAFSRFDHHKDNRQDEDAKGIIPRAHDSDRPS
jgi:uncharacterized membrane protein YhiD involved in acid resistance